MFPGGGGGGSGEQPMISPDQIAMAMKCFSYIKKLPGFLTGFILTLIYMLCIVGRKGFAEDVAPIAGFHLIVFFIVKELLAAWGLGQQRGSAVRERRRARESFADDIAMQYREKLD